MADIKKDQNTVQLEDYLLIIYELEDAYNIAKLTRIANILNLTPGAVNDELKRLARQKLVTKVPYVGVKLTEKGLERAVPVIRKHRIAEALVFDLFGVPWKDSHSIVMRLEHGISDDLEPYILSKLKDRDKCPHGNPIPLTAASLHFTSEKSVSDMSVGERLRVKRIAFEESPVLEYLDTISLRPGNIYRVLRSDRKGVIIRDARNKDYFLDSAVARVIKCEKA